MASQYGENIKLTIFGQSHSAGIGMVLEGIPAGQEIDFEALQAFLDRRAPGKNAFSTARKEADEPEFLGGFVGNRTCGAPIAAVIRNTNARPSDYEALKDVPRPGHADFTARVKYGGFEDASGGGHFSGRLTAALVLAGGIVKQLLEKEGIEILSRVASIGGIADEGPLRQPTSEKAFPTVSDAAGEAMQERIAEVKAEGDSVGGVIECKVRNVPAGLGDPIFDGMENRIAKAVFGIPAVKGIEFGDGFEAAAKKGSENNDAYGVEAGCVRPVTNHAGGILGGITDGKCIRFSVAVKPTPSIAKPQASVDLKTLEPVTVSAPGRHDPCVVVRAVPAVEAAAALAVYDALLNRKKEL